MADAIRVFAPAKINLSLHVVGQRSDGYHLLDSVVAFADVGDTLTISDASAPTLTIGGPEASGLSPSDGNLVTEVARRFWSGAPLQIHLEKRLPVAAGIGGGSADAAACYRGLRGLAGYDPVAMDESARDALLALGADIPMCVVSRTARVTGIGERIAPLPDIPPLPTVLVNPRVGVPTPMVFRMLEGKDNPPIDAPDATPDTLDAVIDWLEEQRNDLAAPALSIAPVIGDVLDAIHRTEECRLARMSGSGATCFGIYPTVAAAKAAARMLSRDWPDWWVAAAKTGVDVKPQLIRATT
ncbi:4-(cytidine 5'-diphospho)-2-C-methyl-D-erythritol kinase [Aestuariibius sp. 2305UL40-4]|uniref:4-(cytidine 5'-diphospho)-2-C-methyl-D-erythritol kinase n=1 Tax=Aestuariibius violaceus TaxID=3234132 RepID=UPI00345E6073